MKAKDIVAKEVARQAEFGYEPSWEDFVIAGRKDGIGEVVNFVLNGNMITKAQLKEWGISDIEL